MEKKPKAPRPDMRMNFSRAMAIIKSQCPDTWARAHAKTADKTRADHGLPGVVMQMELLLDHLSDWEDSYGAVKFLREWVKRHGNQT